MSTTYTPSARRFNPMTKIAAGACAIALSASVASLAFTLDHNAHHASAAPAPASVPAAHYVPATHYVPDTHHVTPAPVPSPAVETLQRQLGQLNYYEGSIDGLMGPQTVAAIQYLQRDAGLPQTGQLNAATNNALANFLAHGNNQMAG